MDLPNFFLIDLPPEAEITPHLVSEAVQNLRANQERYLRARSTHSIIQALVAVGQRWLEPDSPFRRAALELGPGETGFSSPVIAEGIDAFFSRFTAANFITLLEQDLSHPRRVDEFASIGPEQNGSRASLVGGPELLVHIAAGNIPNPSIMSLTLGLLARSAQFMKCAGGGGGFFPRLFAHSIHEADRKLGACLELASWKGGDHRLDQALFDEADCLTATGSDETLSAIQLRLTRRTRFLGYGHRVSFAFVSADVLTGLHATRVIERAALDVTAWDQLGCLSPHVIYVEQGGGVTAEGFAERLAGEIDRREPSHPRGKLPVEIAAQIASRRSIYQLRSCSSDSPETRIWCSPESTAWTVVYEVDPRFQVSCLHRFVYVKPVTSLVAALQGADAVRGKVSTVGLAAPEGRAQEFATELARWGVSRVCPLGRMQQPPLAWRHDGRPALADLLSWTDWEM